MMGEGGGRFSPNLETLAGDDGGWAGGRFWPEMISSQEMIKAGAIEHSRRVLVRVHASERSRSA